MKEQVLFNYANLEDLMIRILGRKMYHESREEAIHLDDWPTFDRLAKFDVGKAAAAATRKKTVVTRLFREFVGAKEKKLRKSNLLNQQYYQLLILQLEQLFVRGANRRKHCMISFLLGLLVDLLASSPDLMNALNHVGVTPCASKMANLLKRESDRAPDTSVVLGNLACVDGVLKILLFGWDNVQARIGTARSTQDNPTNPMKIFTNICVVRGTLCLAQIDLTMFRCNWLGNLANLTAFEVLNMKKAEEMLKLFQIECQRRTVLELEKLKDTEVGQFRDSKLVKRFERNILAKTVVQRFSNVRGVMPFLHSRASRAVESMIRHRKQNEKFSIREIDYMPIKISMISPNAVLPEPEDRMDILEVELPPAGSEFHQMWDEPSPKGFLSLSSAFDFSTRFLRKCSCGLLCENDYGISRCTVLRVCGEDDDHEERTIGGNFFLDGKCGHVVQDSSGVLLKICRPCLSAAPCLHCQGLLGSDCDISTLLICVRCRQARCNMCSGAFSRSHNFNENQFKRTWLCSDCLDGC